MPREKKKSKPFNIRIEKSVYDKLVEFCEVFGQSKTLAVESNHALHRTESDKESIRRWSGKGLAGPLHLIVRGKALFSLSEFFVDPKND